MTLDVSLTEVVSLEEKRLIERARQRVREAVPEVESSRMPTLAILSKGPPSKIGLLFVHGYQGGLCFGNEQVEIPNTIRAIAGLKDH